MAVRLRPMTEAEYADYRAYAVREYANDKIAAGNWKPEEGLQRADQEYTHLLPGGLATPDNFLNIIEETGGGQRVGILWFILNPHKDCWVSDFEIDEPFRRQGYATEALAALETVVRGMGSTRIDLHVFGHNHAARALYQKVGYIETNVNMMKRI